MSVRKPPGVVHKPSQGSFGSWAPIGHHFGEIDYLLGSKKPVFMRVCRTSEAVEKREKYLLRIDFTGSKNGISKNALILQILWEWIEKNGRKTG